MAKNQKNQGFAAIRDVVSSSRFRESRIDISRKKINEINKDWLNQFLLEVASTCIDCSDEWEYRRLVELVVLVLPELKQEVLKLGAQSENEEVREVVEDFQNL